MMIDRRSFLAGAAALAIPAQARSTETERGRSVAEFGVLPDTGKVYGEDFQKAVEKICATGQPVYIPAGSYTVSDVTLPSSRCIINGELGRTVLQPGPSRDRIFTALYSQELEINGIVFEGREEHQGALWDCLILNEKALSLHGGATLCRLTVHGCEFRNISHRAIHTTNVSATFTANRFYNCGTPLTVARARPLLISQCRFENCGSDFVNSSIAVEGQNIQIADNVISGTAFGISVTGDGDIRNNIITGPGTGDEEPRLPTRNASRGMLLGRAIDDVYCLSVRGNSITGCEVGIGVAHDAQWLSITNNTIAGAFNGAIRPIKRYRPAGPDLAKEGAQDYPHLMIAGNVVR
jgi:hypothetical protein